ncbi:hypothetical protein PENTCL1PPCAC_8629, partial [Pristionchus entomophagus]
SYLAIMRTPLIIVLVLLPVAMTMQCYVGQGPNYGAPFEAKNCPITDARGHDFCYKINDNGIISKGCGISVCTLIWQVDECSNNVCCCNGGDLCNDGADSGILATIMTTLVAAAAAWLRV